MNPFTLPVRVYYEDTDAGGVVYHAVYLSYMERARTEWLRALGFEQDVLMREQGLVFAVHRAEVDYLRPARFNDALSVSCQPTLCKGARAEFRQEIRVAGQQDVLCQADIRLACIDLARGRPRLIPAPIAAKLHDVL